MSTDPQFAATVGTEVTLMAATANTNRDGTGTLSTILTAGASGTRVERIKWKATGTTTAGMIRLYAYDGSNARLIEEIPVTAITPSGTVEAWEAEILFGCASPDYPLLIPSGWSLKAAPHNAEAFVSICVAGDF